MRDRDAVPNADLYRYVAALNYHADTEWPQLGSRDEFVQWATRDKSGHVITIVAFRKIMDSLIRRWLQAGANAPPAMREWEDIIGFADRTFREHDIRDDEISAFAILLTLRLTDNDPTFAAMAAKLSPATRKRLQPLVDQQ